MSNTYENNSGKKVTMIIVGLLVVAALTIFALYFVDVDQTKEAKLPDVDVNVTEGQLPKFDVDVGKVEIGSTKVEVPVPEVQLKEKTIELPTLDITPPKQDNAANN